VFGPAGRYPYQANRAYTPPDSPPAAMARMHRTLGIERAVLVQASVHGTDTRAILDAVAADPQRRRAVVAVAEDTPEGELARLAAAGARGFRVNLVDRGGMPFASPDAIARMAGRVRDLGWHAEFLVHADTDADFLDLARRLPVPVVVGHLGYARPPATPQDPGYRRFLGLVEEGRCWVKLTGPYRVSSEADPPYRDVAAFAAALLQTRPDRVVWGSDWPHVMVTKPMPNDADLLDLLGDWAADPAHQRRILAEAPAELYGFAPAAAAEGGHP
jgi:predicted TIM-barrel fold metal-dependent hydrolase